MAGSVLALCAGGFEVPGGLVMFSSPNGAQSGRSDCIRSGDPGHHSVACGGVVVPDAERLLGGVEVLASLAEIGAGLTSARTPRLAAARGHVS